MELLRELHARSVWWIATLYARWFIWRHGQRPADNWLSWWAVRLKYRNRSKNA